MNPGPSSPPMVAVPCPACKQTLNLPTSALNDAFQCPRCGRVASAADLVPITTPVHAVPVRASDPRASSPSGAAWAPATPPTPAAHQGAPYAGPVAQALAIPPAHAAQFAPAAPPHDSTPYAGSMGYASTVPPPPAGAMQGVAPAPASGPTPAPPSPYAPPAGSPSAPGPLTQALELGAQGTRHIGRFGNALMRFSDAIDGGLVGYRARVVGVAAFVAVMASVVEPRLNPPAPVFMALSTWLFIGILVVLLLARLGSFRDEQGDWSSELVWRRLEAWISGWREALSGSGDLPVPARLHAVGRMAATFGIVVLACRNLLALVGITATEISLLIEGTSAQASSESALDVLLLYVGAGFAGFGVACRLLGWLRRPQDTPARLGPAEQRQLVEASARLPCVLDCANPAAMEAAARTAAHPVLRQLLEALARWRPRRFQYEEQYEASLYRFLRRRLPWASPEQQYPLRRPEGGRPLRADLVVSDCVLFELKRGLDASTAQRALGQVHTYHLLWGRGPIVLLVCDTDWSTAERCLFQPLQNLRLQVPVVLVLAHRVAN